MSSFQRILFFCFFLVFLFHTPTMAQDHLQKKLSISRSQVPLKELLKLIEQEAGFIFSYNSHLLPADSLVSLQVQNLSVEQSLYALFGKRFRYQQSGRHLIVIPLETEGKGQLNWLSGYVLDEENGQPIAFASVFEPHQLVGTLTDERGYFSLQIKGETDNSFLNVRKLSYSDTLVKMADASGSPIRINIKPIAYPIDTVVILNQVERNWLARRLLSSRQIVNSMNLSGFFARQPLQVSLVPGLGSHGRMGAQVVNKFSLNVLGGYTAGVNGLEIASLFNIVKQDMQYVQIAGLFNIVGGSVRGLQIAGLYNTVRKPLTGVQIGGLVNTLNGKMKGLQIAGLYNKAEQMRGLQIAGLGNSSRGQNSGIQVAGLFQHTTDMKGLQIAGILNKNKNFSGLQIALINIADTNRGYSIGLINISKTGYHKASLSYDETGTAILSYKSGNPKMYSILSLGSQLNLREKAFAVGYGLGSDLPIYQQKWFFNPELNHYYFYTGNWHNQHMLERLSLQFKYRFNAQCSIFAGPSINVLHNKPGESAAGYKPSVYSNGIQLGKGLKAWPGFTIGVEVF